MSDTFHIPGLAGKKFRVFRRENGVFAIQFSRTQKPSLKTRDVDVARKRAEIAVEKYYEKKIIALRRGKSQTLTEYLEEYLSNRQDLSSDTRAMDKTAIASFVDIVGNKMIADVTTADVNKFKRVHQAKGNTKTTVNSYLRHLKAFFNQAKRDKQLTALPDMKKLKTGASLPRILTKNERERILKQALADDPEMYRVILFDLHTGCRRAEIVGARWENYNPEVGVLRITGKGDKQRVVPILPPALAAMGEPREAGPIFLQAHADTYSHRFKKIAVTCRIFDFPLKNLRHSAATNMLESGIPLEVVQRILGHTDIKTTQIYARVMDELMVQEMKKFRWE